jgi:hypothetical protein
MIDPQSYYHRDYEIVVSHTPPYFQAAINPTRPDLPNIDLGLAPIRAVNVMSTVELAKQRIDQSLRAPRAGPA